MIFRNLLQRPERQIIKPKRYMTTSSSGENDTAIKRKEKFTEKNDDIDLESDVNDIRKASNDKNINHSSIPERGTRYWNTSSHINQYQQLNNSSNGNVNGM